MQNLRCQCGKIVCQFQDNTIVIKCRHCKRFIVIRINSQQTGKQDLDHLAKIEYR